MLRSQVREEIFKIVFRIAFVSEEELEEQIVFSLEDLEGKSEKNLLYIKDKAMAIHAHLKELDEKIESCCAGWNLNRIGNAELTIMRIAVYEIMFEEMAPNIAINEAVELTKIYCDDGAKSFVNAVLGKVAKSLE